VNLVGVCISHSTLGCFSHYTTEEGKDSFELRINLFRDEKPFHSLSI